MSFFRSESMLHKKLRLPRDDDSCVAILTKLGRIKEGCIQFLDLSEDVQEKDKSYYQMIDRCEKNEKVLTELAALCGKYKIHNYTCRTYNKFEFELGEDQKKKGITSNSKYFDDTESKVLGFNKEIESLLSSNKQLEDDLNYDIQKKIVYEKYLEILFNKKPSGNEMDLIIGLQNIQRMDQSKSSAELLNNNLGFNLMGQLSFLVGVLLTENDLKFKRLIFRVSRGRALVSTFDYCDDQYRNIKNNKNNVQDIDDDDTDTVIDKTKRKIFIILYPNSGGHSDYLRNKILNIAQILGCTTYEIDQESTQGIQNEIAQLGKEIENKIKIVKSSHHQIKKLLASWAGGIVTPGEIDRNLLYFKKMKLIYNALNKCIVKDTYIMSEVWIVEDLFPDILKELKHLSSEDINATFINLEETELIKPTFIPTNEFLDGFQSIVNTYGTPRYKEINPGYFNIVFFPFLFGIMFGDVGHGFVLFTVSLYLLINASKIKTKYAELNSVYVNAGKDTFLSILNTGVPYRYFILLMAIFSIFCGLLYNDFLGVPMPFSSCYTTPDPGQDAFKRIKDCTYKVGIDAKWYASSNELAFINSFKMKFSVIIGVFQMTIGIILKGLNDIYYRDAISFIFEFIPEIIFMCLLFGYMVVLIYIKWCKNWDELTISPPSIITQMVNIVINKGSVDNAPIWGKSLGNNEYQQEKFHRIILIICGCAIPLMIFPKPIIKYIIMKSRGKSKNSKEDRKNSNYLENEEEKKQFLQNEGEEEDLKALNEVDRENIRGANISYFDESSRKKREEGFVDLFVEQLIIAVEFILGTVSNTASYLRLWALSLAHSQLSEVFLEKSMLNLIIEGNLHYGLSFIMVVICFFLFANITIFILMFMDLMECFLHTLRLHWVEFQNKFFYADGIPFQPFLIKNIMDER
ncbi:MAG: V-type ATPase subunit a family protein [archaeon]|nr:V-type ATPase subunit a family protein [archaeon]